MMTTIEVISRRERTYKVKCTSYGGRPLSISITGPRNFNQTNTQLPVLSRMGGDLFSFETDDISVGRHGDVYQCTSSNGVSFKMGSVKLQGY